MQASSSSTSGTDPEQLSRLMAALDDIDRLGVEGAQKVWWWVWRGHRRCGSGHGRSVLRGQGAQNGVFSSDVSTLWCFYCLAEPDPTSDSLAERYVSHSTCVELSETLNLWRVEGHLVDRLFLPLFAAIGGRRGRSRHRPAAEGPPTRGDRGRLSRCRGEGGPGQGGLSHAVDGPSVCAQMCLG